LGGRSPTGANRCRRRCRRAVGAGGLVPKSRGYRVGARGPRGLGFVFRLFGDDQCVVGGYTPYIYNSCISAQDETPGAFPLPSVSRGAFAVAFASAGIRIRTRTKVRYSVCVCVCLYCVGCVCVCVCALTSPSAPESRRGVLVHRSSSSGKPGGWQSSSSFHPSVGGPRGAASGPRRGFESCALGSGRKGRSAPG
jgi:hypothetical protein